MEATLSSSFLAILSISFSFLFVTYPASSIIVCPYSSCDETGPVIRFPFRIKGFQPARCGYPGYGLTCNHLSQTILTLPASGDFVVHDIDYINQWIYVNDPNSCLPKRILQFSLAGSKFGPTVSKNYTLFNCSASRWSDYIITGSVPVFCMGSANSTVIALDGGDSTNLSRVPTPVCREVARVVSPVELTAVNPIPDMKLTWQMPICMICEAAGGICGYVGETGSEVGCFNIDGSSGDGSRGLPRSAKYGIIIGVGIPGLVCLIALVCYCCGKVRMYSRRRRLDAQLSNLTSNPQPMIMIAGLDGATIESYPKTVLGESRRLPRPNDDGTCPICLAEYQPKESLRTIPECNHYFHAKCVDEWLRINATCPLCRNTPAESSIVTPSSSVSSSTSLSIS